MPLYLSLVAAIASDVASGELPPGDSLPPHRELAQQLGLSPGTVAKAYAEARRRGLVEGSRREGTRVRYAGSLDRMLSRSQRINFSSSYPNPAIGPDLASALLAVRARKPALIAYPPTEGHDRHRAVAASWLQMLGIAPSSLSMLPTAGAQHGLSVAIAALLDAGDTIAAGTLCYPGLMAAARLRGVQVAGVAHDDQGLDPDELDSLCRHREVRALYCTPSAANPTGHTMPLDRKEALAKVATKHGLVVIEDEAHRPYLERSSPPIAAVLPQRTVLLVSVSKVLLGGVRVGFAVAHPDTAARLRLSLQADLLATSALDLDLVAALIESGDADRVIARRRAEVGRRKALAGRVLGEIAAPARERDGPFLWLRTPSSMTSEAVTELAEARGVSVVPASAFATSGHGYRDGFRVALSAPAEDAEVERGLKILRDVLVGGRSVRLSSWAV
jgi:DNA-binding transcriptional MocR family regulator